MTYCVYFYYDKNKELLYVGKSKDVYYRWLGHNDTWKKEVVYIGVREYPDEASMDIFEHYYIAKLDSKYNIARLEHGKTTIDILDNSSLTIYSIHEFSSKYSRNHSKKPAGKSYLFKEKIELTGNTIIELDSPEINLFDDEILHYDLDRTCFKYKNIYLHSKYLKLKGQYIPKNEHTLSYRTNTILKELKEVIKQVKITNNGVDEYGSIEYMLIKPSNNHPKEFIEPLVSLRGLFSTTIVNYTSSNRERTHWTSYPGYFFSSFALIKDPEVMYFMSCNTPVFKEGEYMQLTADKLIYNLQSICTFAEKE